jgi:zinc transport system substrate-binding protein
MNVGRVVQVLCRKAFPGLALLLVSLALAGPAPAPPPKPRVLASFYPLYDWARQVGGDRIEAVNLLAAGVEPHDFEPTPADVRRIREADLVIGVGAGFQPSLDKVLRTLRGDRPARLAVTDGLKLKQGAGGRSHKLDPHVWLDPDLAQDLVRKIADALGRVDPAGQATFDANAAGYIAKLAALDQEFRTGLAACQRKEVFTSHAAFAYLLDRYGLEQVGVRGLSPEAEPSPRQLARLAKLAKERGVKVVYYETLVSPKVAETLAREIGAKTLVLNPIEGRTATEAAQDKDYLALMRENLASLRIGQACGP